MKPLRAQKQESGVHADVWNIHVWASAVVGVPSSYANPDPDYSNRDARQYNRVADAIFHKLDSELSDRNRGLAVEIENL